MSQSSLDLEARVAALEADRAAKSPVRHLSRKRLGIILLAVALATPAVVLASHTFTDVPVSSSFHNQISVLADAGITKGCNPPTNNHYCPADPVRRDQMAAFLIRAVGRQSQVAIGVVYPTAGDVVASTTIKTEGTAQVNGLATFNAIIDVGGASELYPCTHLFYVSIDGSAASDSSESWAYIGADVIPSTLIIDSLVSNMSMTVGAGTHTVQLIHNGSPDGECSIRVWYGQLTASVVPFGGLGGTPVEPAIVKPDKAPSTSTVK